MSEFRFEFLLNLFPAWVWQYPIIGLDYVLAPNRWQAIILTNDGLVYWGIYTSLGLDGLTHWKLKQIHEKYF